MPISARALAPRATIPGVGGESRIGDVLLGLQLSDEESRLRERALNQRGTETLLGALGIQDLLGQGLGLYRMGKEQAFRSGEAAREREFAGSEAEKDRQLTLGRDAAARRDSALAALQEIQERERSRQFGLEQGELGRLQEEMDLRRSEGREDELLRRGADEAARRRAEETAEKRATADRLAAARLRELELGSELDLGMQRDRQMFEAEQTQQEREDTFLDLPYEERVRRGMLTDLLSRHISAVDADGKPLYKPEEVMALQEMLFNLGEQVEAAPTEDELLEPGEIEPIEPTILDRFRPAFQPEISPPLPEVIDQRDFIPAGERTASRRLRGLDLLRPDVLLERIGEMLRAKGDMPPRPIFGLQPGTRQASLDELMETFGADISPEGRDRRRRVREYMERTMPRLPRAR